MNLGSFTTPLTTSSLKSTVTTARPTTKTTRSAETASPTTTTTTTRTTKSETTARATDVPTSRQVTTTSNTQKPTTTKTTQRPTTTTKTTAQKPKPNYTTEVKIEKVTVAPTTLVSNVPPTTKKSQSNGNKNKFSDYPISSGLSESENKLSSSSGQKRIDLFYIILSQFTLFNLLFVFYDCYV